MLTQKRNQVTHANPESLNLVAWKISSIENLRQNFLRKLRNTSNKPKEAQPGNYMEQDWQFKEAGVIDTVSLQILPL